MDSFSTGPVPWYSGRTRVLHATGGGWTWGWWEGRFLGGWQFGDCSVTIFFLEFFVGLAASLYFLAMFTRFLPLMKEDKFTKRCCTVADCTRSGAWRVLEIPRLGVPKQIFLKESVHHLSLYSDTFRTPPISDLTQSYHRGGKFRSLHVTFFFEGFFLFGGSLGPGPAPGNVWGVWGGKFFKNSKKVDEFSRWLKNTFLLVGLYRGWNTTQFIFRGYFINHETRIPEWTNQDSWKLVFFFFRGSIGSCVESTFQEVYIYIFIIG